jgi:single-strand DNA-binding protein
MAGSVNKCIIVGNLGKDPESRTFQRGDKVVSFSVATSESWKDRASGERKERVEWHKISIYNQGLCTVAENYLRKGSKVYLEGQLETRSWTDKDGATRYSTEIALRPFRSELTLLDSKRDSDSRGDDDYDRETGEVRTQQTRAPVDDLEDEVPF